MHERQYRDMKSGAAKNRFNQELEQAKEKTGTPIVIKRPVVEIPMFSFEEISAEYPHAKPIHAPCKGQVIWQYDLMDASTAPFEGATIEKGDNLCYIQSYYGIEPVEAGYAGTIVGTYVGQGKEVQKGEILAFIS
jgi:pyruvate carboxylase subunit B